MTQKVRYLSIITNGRHWLTNCLQIQRSVTVAIIHNAPPGPFNVGVGIWTRNIDRRFRSSSTMAIPPQFAASKLALGKSPSHAINTIELFLDYCCPFSAKQYKTIYQSVLPEFSSKPYANNVQFVFRQQIQPFHGSSTLMHESAIAVLKLAPSKFWDYSAKLFEKQTDFFDVNVVNEGRNQTYQRLAKLGSTVGIDESKMYDLLQVSDKPASDGSLNVGNGVTNDLKLLIKIARLTGIHVSPTVVFNVSRGEIDCPRIDFNF